MAKHFPANESRETTLNVEEENTPKLQEVCNKATFLLIFQDQQSREVKTVAFTLYTKPCKVGNFLKILSQRRPKVRVAIQ